jgi:protein-disulfide isomerase
MNVMIRRRRLLLTLAALPALALLGACGEGEETPEAPKAELPPDQGAYDAAKLLADNPMPEMMIGKAEAPVTIIEYASMTCPHCARFHSETLPAIKEKYIDTGRARLILREFGFDPRAEAGFMLARCSGDKYFAMVDVLFKQQDSWARAENGRAALLSIARLAGFSQESFEACLTDQKLLEDVRAVKTRGETEFGVDSTPTFFINGRKYTGALTVDEMSAIIDSI